MIVHCAEFCSITFRISPDMSVNINERQPHPPYFSEPVDEVVDFISKPVGLGQRIQQEFARECRLNL